MLKTWTRCENTGEGADVEVASSPSRNLRNASKMVESSPDGDGVGGLTSWVPGGASDSGRVETTRL